MAGVFPGCPTAQTGPDLRRPLSLLGRRGCFVSQPQRKRHPKTEPSAITAQAPAMAPAAGPATAPKMITATPVRAKPISSSPA